MEFVDRAVGLTKLVSTTWLATYGSRNELGVMCADRLLLLI